MLIFLVGFTEFGILSLLAFNIVAVLIYRWNHPGSEVVWIHTTEALNFQVLWSAVMWIAMLIFPFFGLTVWPFVWIAGIALGLVYWPGDRELWQRQIPRANPFIPHR